MFFGYKKLLISPLFFWGGNNFYFPLSQWKERGE